MSSRNQSMKEQIAEAKHIREQLKLRWNTTDGCFEVFTTIYGTGVFRWYKISEATADWYKDTFNLPIITAAKIDYETGALNSYTETVKE